MHAYTALESINEKIAEEQLSQEEEDEDASDDQIDSEDKSSSHQNSSGKREKPRDLLSRQEYLSKINEIRTKEIERVTIKISEQWDEPTDPALTGSIDNPLHEIPVCLLNHSNIGTDFNGV